MDTTQCISNIQWERYAENKLDAAALHALQQHVAGCELCADIKEGIDGLVTPVTLGQTVIQINSEVDRRLTAKPRRFVLLYWSAAAAIVFAAIGVGNMLMKTPTGDVATVAPVDTTAGIKTDSGMKMTEIISEKEPLPANTERVYTPKSKTNKEEDKMTFLTQNAPLKSANNNFSQTEDKASVTDKEGYDYDAFKKVAGANNSGKDSLARIVYLDNMAGDSLPPWAGALAKAYKHEIYPSGLLNNNATNNFSNNIFLGKDFYWGNADSLSYYTALINFDLARYDSCLQSIGPILQNPESDYYEDALLLNARILLKRKEKEAARTLLSDIILLNGKRKKEAQKLLDSIK